MDAYHRNRPVQETPLVGMPVDGSPASSVGSETFFRAPQPPPPKAVMSGIILSSPRAGQAVTRSRSSPLARKAAWFSEPDDDLPLPAAAPTPVPVTPMPTSRCVYVRVCVCVCMAEGLPPSLLLVAVAASACSCPVTGGRRERRLSL